jgi:hypothetical protein
MVNWIEKKSFKHGIVIAALALVIAGCASVVAVPPGPYVVSPSMTLNIGRIWTDFSPILPNQPKKVKMLSIDGPLLNRLYVGSDLVAGEGLTKPANKEVRVPTVKAQMSGIEQIEFLKDSMASFDFRNVTTSRPRQVQLSGKPAIRVDLSGSAQDGLEFAATGIMQKNGDTYNVLLFAAPKEHYFGVILSEFNQLAGST